MVSKKACVKTPFEGQNGNLCMWQNVLLKSEVGKVTGNSVTNVKTVDWIGLNVSDSMTEAITMSHCHIKKMTHEM